MKTFISMCIGWISSLLLFLFGDVGVPFWVLLSLMCLDFIMGILMGFLNKSKKTNTGGLSSRVGLIGLVKKCLILVFVIVGHFMDVLLGFNYIQNIVIIGFSVNEIISLTENASLMGLPLPNIIVKAIELLKEKENNE